MSPEKISLETTFNKGSVHHLAKSRADARFNQRRLDLNCDVNIAGFGSIGGEAAVNVNHVHLGS